jgi:hypothetical protein
MMRATKLADFPDQSEVASISYEPNTLVIHLSPGRTLKFDDVLGFRVLDERDLGEFWPECSARHGALFEVHGGGWLDQESARPGFLSRTVGPQFREFLITGPNDCVSVFAYEEPTWEADAL